jgi:hypothetical protein
MNPKPAEVVVVLGKEHGCKDVALMKSIYPGVIIVKYPKPASFGKLRNIGIAKTTSEWTWFVSVDDKPMPDAITTFERALSEKGEADYICAKWYTIGLGKPLMEHRSPTPIDSAIRMQSGKGMGFIIPHSPFKRFLWQKHKYVHTDLPNYDFVLGCVNNGARFIQSDIPTTTYLRRSDSHARTKLLTRTIKRQANLQKKLMQNGIREYYKDKIKT